MTSSPPAAPTSPDERERVVERIADRLDGPMTVLGIIFLLLVLAENVVTPTGTLSTLFTGLSWLLWTAFVAEFVVRAVVAPSTARFLRRNGWQVVFLALPFLRFLRILARLRLRPLLQGGRLLSSAIRGTRTAARQLSGRLAWLSAVSVIVVLTGSQIAYQWLGYDEFGRALHAVVLLTVTGQSLGREEPLALVLDVLGAVYSVVVFASLAGMLGAYFLAQRAPETAAGGQVWQLPQK